MRSLILATADEVAYALAARIRALRLQRGWTQVELAARAGMSVASYKRFEQTGAIAFESLLRAALALDRIGDFDAVFQPPPFRTLDEAVAKPPERKRAPRRAKPSAPQ